MPRERVSVAFDYRWRRVADPEYRSAAMRLAYMFLLLLGLTTACAPKAPVQSGIVVPANLSADEGKVLAIARQFVSTNQNWLDAEFERPMRRTGGGWTVLVWKLPKTPELDMMISIDDDRQIKDSHIGFGL